jgi:hypothetical protein
MKKREQEEETTKNKQENFQVKNKTFNKIIFFSFLNL